MPSAKLVAVNVPVQATAVPPSSEHSMTVGASVVVNVHVGVASFVGPFGPPVIVTVGCTVSTLNVALALAVLPAASVTRTVNVCAPSPSVEVVCGDVHDANAAASTAQSTRIESPDGVKPNVGVA